MYEDHILLVNICNNSCDVHFELETTSDALKILFFQHQKKNLAGPIPRLPPRGSTQSARAVAQGMPGPG